MISRFVSLRSMATHIRRFTVPEFHHACFQEVSDRSFLVASEHHTLVYVCVFRYGGDNRWMLKYGKTDCSVEKRFSAHRNSYGVDDTTEHPPIIPLMLIKCINSIRHESNIKKLCQKYLHKVDNMSRVDSKLTEQTYDITKAYDAIKGYCDEKDVKYWDSTDCEINDDNDIKWKGEWITGDDDDEDADDEEDEDGDADDVDDYDS